MFFIWKDSFNVGVGVMDRDHQELVPIVQRLQEAALLGKSNDETQIIVQQLTVHVHQHFAAEEALMLQYHYPEIEEHKKAHQLVTQQVLSFVARVKAKQPLLVGELMDFLMNFITNHVMVVDRKLAKFLNSVKVR